MCMVFYLLPISFVAQLVERTAYNWAGEPVVFYVPISFVALALR